ncbi:hypothetical protein AMTR_s00039p00079720 [Amborella trichopoda]|uniref:Uncharacterized protein n=1 Tax=Amborella trichopoda TaxID=13333 RepID=U5D000_AMBTC|nr:hypothetical protein AMTR_s00039p00079720 [Amborella trichopoda]
MINHLRPTLSYSSSTMSAPPNLKLGSGQEAPSDGVMVLVVQLPAQSHLNQLLTFVRLRGCRAWPACRWSLLAQKSTRDRPLTASVALIAPPFPTSGFTCSPSHNFLQVPGPPPACLRCHFTPLTVLVRELASSHRRVVVIHDAAMSVAAGAAAECPP